MAADIFGDSSLFEEFDKTRESNGTFISKTEVRENDSTVVFNMGGSDSSSSDSDDDDAANYPNCESHSCTDSHSDSVKRVHDREELEVKKDVSVSDVLNRIKENPDSGVNNTDKNSTNFKLQYERNTFLRFAKLIDSTRNVPDESSPVVQIIFQNNSFARKNRCQIENFIRHLLDKEEFEKMHNQEKLPDLWLKPSTPTCIDINSNLPIDLRTEKMRKSHAIIGQAQFHMNFMVDSIGWPLVDFDPSLTPSWELPVYTQELKDPLPVDEEELEKQAQKNQQSIVSLTLILKVIQTLKTKSKQECWNCGGDHMLTECQIPRNQQRIQQKKQEFMFAKSQKGQGKMSSVRYHVDAEESPRFSQFKPGFISDGLRDALGLEQNQLPPYIYRMRMLGYPPGWLAEAQQDTSGLVIFDKHGKETNESGSGSAVDASLAASLDVEKIIEYPGFTVEIPEGTVDDHMQYGMPALQTHQLKETLLAQTAVTNELKKRKKDAEEKIQRKKQKLQNKEGEMDIDDEDTDPSLIQNGAEFIPPLPLDTPPQKPPPPGSTPPSQPQYKYPPTPADMSKPPLPSDTPPGLPPLPDGSPSTSSKRNPSRMSSRDSGRSESPSLETLEEQYKKLVQQLDVDGREENSDADMIVIDSCTSDDESKIQSQGMNNDAVNVSSPDFSVKMSPSSPSESDSTLNSSTPRIQSSRSLSKDYGTPIVVKEKSINRLPDRKNFRVGVEQHVLFENLPETTGTFEKIQGLIKIIQKKKK